jgi:hypothetical protein
MLGQIESFRRDIGAGIIRCEDGRKVRFQRANLINARDPLVGEEVDFLLDGRTPQSIIVLAGSPWSVFAGAATFPNAPSGRLPAGASEGATETEAYSFDWRLAA